jgi:hypothetical protein
LCRCVGDEGLVRTFAAHRRRPLIARERRSRITALDTVGRCQPTVERRRRRS